MFSLKEFQTVIVISQMDLDKSYPSIFELLWYSQLPCFDVKDVTSKKSGQFGLIKGCSWKGVSLPCSAIFNMAPTDRSVNLPVNCARSK